MRRNAHFSMRSRRRSIWFMVLLFVVPIVFGESEHDETETLADQVVSWLDDEIGNYIDDIVECETHIQLMKELSKEVKDDDISSAALSAADILVHNNNCRNVSIFTISKIMDIISLHDTSPEQFSSELDAIKRSIKKNIERVQHEFVQVMDTTGLIRDLISKSGLNQSAETEVNFQDLLQEFLEISRNPPSKQSISIPVKQKHLRYPSELRGQLPKSDADLLILLRTHMSKEKYELLFEIDELEYVTRILAIAEFSVRPENGSQDDMDPMLDAEAYVQDEWEYDLGAGTSINLLLHNNNGHNRTV